MHPTMRHSAIQIQSDWSIVPCVLQIQKSRYPTNTNASQYQYIHLVTQERCWRCFIRRPQSIPRFDGINFPSLFRVRLTSTSISFISCVTLAKVGINCVTATRKLCCDERSARGTRMPNQFNGSLIATFLLSSSTLTSSPVLDVEVEVIWPSASLDS